MKPEVSIVLPAFNEEAAIAKVIDDVQAAMKGSKQAYEILVVDDHSSDCTAAIAESKGVRVVRRPLTRGSGASRRTGAAGFASSRGFRSCPKRLPNIPFMPFTF